MGMSIYKGYEGDVIPVELMVKSLSPEGTIKVVKASATIIGGNVKSGDIELNIKGDNIVHGLIGQEYYKFPGAYVAYIKCTFDDGSTRTFPVSLDVMSKDDLTKQVMLDRWNQLAELHRKGEDVVPEATRLLKSMEEGGYLTDYIKKMMSHIDEM
jgi:hypothetical protein